MCWAPLLATNVHQQKAYWCVMIYLGPFPFVPMWPMVDIVAKMVEDTKHGHKSSNDNLEEYMNASCHDQHLGNFAVLQILIVNDC